MKLFRWMPIVAIILCPLIASTQEPGDIWDPEDGLFENATVLPVPSATGQSHGPHTLSATDVYDWFKFTLQENVTYDLYATGDSDTQAELFASDGTSQVASDDDNGPDINFRIRYQANQSGVYYLRVRLYAPDRDGAYTLHFIARSGLSVPPDEWDLNDGSAAGATQLAIAYPVDIQHGPHTLSETDINDWFSMDLQEGITYQFSSAGNSDVLAELYGSDGSTRLAMDDDGGEDGNFSLIFTIVQQGRHYLRVKTFEDGFVASYTLRVISDVEALPAGDQWDPADDISDGSTELGPPQKLEQNHGPHSLSPTDRSDWFLFALTRGATYRFSSAGSSDTIADLYQADGITFISTDDNSGTGNNFSITFTPQSDGKYYLRVRSFQDMDASYNVTFILLDEPLPSQADEWDPADNVFSGAADLGLPSIQTAAHGPHSLLPDDREDWFAVQLTAGVQYEFWTSGSSDTVGELFQADGFTGITQQDDGGSGYNFYLFYTPVINGTYYLRVRMFDQGSRGSYHLHYNESSPIPSGEDIWDDTDNTFEGATPLGFIDSFEQHNGPHTLSSTDTADWFRLSLAVGALYEIYSSGDSDTKAELYLSDGKTLAGQYDDEGTSNNFRIVFPPSIGGTYYLKVSEPLSGDAAYTLHYFGAAHPVSLLQAEPVFTLQSEEEITVVPGGFNGHAAGTAQVGPLPANPHEITDSRGATLTTAPGEVMLVQLPQVDSGNSTILLRAQIATTGPGAAVALAALDGSLDGSIATNVPADSGIFLNRYQWMTLIFTPPNGAFYPIVQLANTGGTETVSLYLDTVEVYALPKDAQFSSGLLKPSIESDTTSVFPPIPHQTYNLVSDREYTEQAGGFNNAQPGSVSIGDIPPTDNPPSDGIGATLTVQSQEVEMLLFPSLEVDEDVVLVRARIKTSGQGATIALAALNGSLDGSIATNMLVDSGKFQDDYQWITLTYDSPGTAVVPLLQIAGNANGDRVSLYLDTVEIYRYPKGSGISTRLLYNN